MEELKFFHLTDNKKEVSRNEKYYHELKQLIMKNKYINYNLFFIPLFLLLGIASNAQCTVPTVERDALIALYNATDGANWINNSNWNTTAPVCDWYGVTVENGNVVNLNLFNNQLTGAIPLELSDLTNLSGLFLGNNQLSGALPLEIGNLIGLTTFNISYNQLSGNIPLELGNLLNLTHFYINNNNFTGPIPASFGNFTNVQDFRLNNNQLSGNIPVELNNLINVRNLSLQVNQLSGLIPDLGNLNNLTSLGLRNNQLSGSIPLWVFNILNTSSIDIYLQNNQLSGSIPNNINNSNVRRLDLSNNQLTGIIPSELSNLINLETLSLYNNQLTGSIPSELGALINLEVLLLNSNELSGSIPLELGNLGQLKHLWLGNNQLTGSIPSVLGDLSNLELLFLDNNELIDSIPSELGALSKITHLQLQNNQITGSIPSELGTLSKITHLQLQSNQLTGSIPAELENLTSLVSLTLNDNQLSGAIPTFLNTISTLQTLNFQNNEFIFSDFENEHNNYTTSLFSYGHLPQAKVDQEEIITVTESTNQTLTTSLNSPNNSYQWYKDGVAISGATSKDYTITGALPADAGVYYVTATNSIVTGLTLQRNDITVTVTADTCGVSTAERDALIALYNATDGANWTNNTNWNTAAPVCDWYGVIVENGTITQLNLTSNGLIGTIPTELSALTELRGFRLDYNQLTGSIPSWVFNLQSTSSIDILLNNNQLSGVLPTTMNSPNIRYLYLNRNQLQGDIPIQIENLTNVERLRISDNDFTGTIPNILGNLANLKELWLNGNQLSGQIPNELGNLLNLNDLRLSANELSSAIPNELGGLTSLTILNLGGNQLSGTIPSAFGNLTNLTALTLDNNQLTGTIPSTFGNLINLITLTLNNNLLTGEIPLEFQNLINIRDLRFNDNQLNGIIPIYLANHTNLISLIFRNNDFIFNDFETEHSGYTNLSQQYSYAPQAKVDEEETINVFEGAGFTLTTSLSSPNNSYQWYKNGVAIPGATNKEYIITEDASAIDEGVYYVTATNSIVTGLTLQRNDITVTVTVDECDISEEERDALIALYNATNGPNWTNNTNWNTSASVCDWYGVTVTNGTVTNLNLSNNQLSGNIPLELVELTNLISLSLNDNQLSGTIPSGLSEINGFTVFQFRDNNFVFRDFENEHAAYVFNKESYIFSPQAKVDQVETINSIEGASVTLTTSLSSPNNNYQWYKFFGEEALPIEGATNREYVIEAVGQLDAGVYYVTATNNIVEGLTLERHPITLNVAQEPVDACGVPLSQRDALLALYASTNGDQWTNTQANNQPWDINVPVCDWYGISTEDSYGNGVLQIIAVDLRFNNLSGIIPSEIENLPDLRFLYLSNNQLVSAIPNEIANLTSLSELDLNENQLSGSIPNGIHNLQSLYRLNLGSNQLSGIIPSLINIVTGEEGETLSSTPYYLNIGISNNAFVFSEMEQAHLDLMNRLQRVSRGDIDEYSYGPQAKVDQVETINVNQGDPITLSTTRLTSPNNSYQWYKDGVEIVGATDKDYIITNVTSADSGVYHFIATNSILVSNIGSNNSFNSGGTFIDEVDRLALERHPITLNVTSNTPNNFCTSELGGEYPIVADLTPSGSNIVWYATEIGGVAYNNDDEIIEQAEDLGGVSYWWDDITDGVTTRTEVTVLVDQGIPEGEDYQEFATGATVADLQAIGTNIQWYDSAFSQTPLDPTTPLIHEGFYYADDVGVTSCRLLVDVYVGTLPPDADGVQYVCPDQTLIDLTVLTQNGATVLWYAEATGGTALPFETPLVAESTYYAAQIGADGFESIERTGVTIFFNEDTPPEIPFPVQTFYSDQSHTISDLYAIGYEITWHSQAEGGQTYADDYVLINGETYYAQQQIDGCSSKRAPVTVEILEEESPDIIGCETFRPQFGDRYVISGWVREQGVIPVNPEERNFNNSEISDLFVDLMNHLKDRFLSEEVNMLDFPEEYIPQSNTENLNFDPLIPYIKDTEIDERKLTVYNFSREEDDFGRAIGFSFYLNRARTYKFEYETPLIEVPLCTSCFNQQFESVNYPLKGKGLDILDFNSAQINNDVLSINYTLVVPDGSSITENTDLSLTQQEIILPEIAESGISESVIFNDFQIVENFQPINYANSQVELVYTDSDGAELTSETISFSPQGHIIDGWQRIVGEFSIPEMNSTTAVLLNIILKNNGQEASESTEGLNVYFDDIRMHPYESNMKTFVYDPVTQRLMSELDENNYATYYEYDTEGGLIRVKKETEKGVYTIQETRSGNIKTSN
ncbi:hypothetical protein D7030_08395 [Flavobacteriaceae bacterium AU392]|nr:hypothetical protein D1817_00020 [Flavobacteriaceae bacterium]RKM85138.1 hypothetical protein D7030_08395 [Flavobacteriaceae bacterium AU392]